MNNLNSKNIEDIIKYSEEAFKSLFYNNPEALVFLDREGKVIDINQKFIELFGYTLEEIKGKDLNEGLIVPDELVDEGKKLDEIALKTGYINFESIRRKKDGTLIPVLISGSPVIINGEVKGIIGLYIDLTEKKKKEDELKFLSIHDALTGVYNKSFLEERFKIEKARYERYKKGFAILFLDLYEFKIINDLYGHSFGDKVLKIISEKILNIIRKCDILARIGGDEFVILLTDIECEKDVISIINRIIGNVFDNFEVDEKKLNIGVNIGISIYPLDGEELDELIKKSDIAMYHAKSIGKNSFSFYNKDFEKEKKGSIIRRLETKFESIFNNIPIGIILLNKNRTIDFVNKRVVDILSIDKSEIVGNNLFEILKIKDLEDEINKFLNNELENFTHEIEYFKKDNEKIYLKLNFYYFKDSEFNINYYLINIEDITREKILNHNLRKERELLKNILDNIEAVVTIEDLDGNVLFINKKGLEILECREDEAIGKNWIDEFTPLYYKEEMRNFYKELKSGKIEKFEIHENPVLTKNGEERIILWKNSFMKDSNGKTFLLSSGLDITELKIKEEEREYLIEALKDELYFENKLREITNIINSQRDLDSLLNRFLEEIERVIPSTSSNIALLEDSKLVNKAIRGYEKFGIRDFVINFKHDLDKFSIERKVIESKKPYIIYDTKKEKDWIVLNETRYIKSHMIIPIISRDKIIGCLRLDGDKENQFSNKDVDRLILICNSLGLAIENIKYLEKTKSFLDQIMILVTRLSELKDPYTGGHQKNVCKIATKIAEKMNLSKEKIEVIKYASLLHDIGKIILPYEILTKPFKLTSREYELVKEHPKYGYELLKELDLPYPIKDIIIQHHERENGSGYPYGLKGDEILLEAKIIAVADVFDAMISHRPYRPAHSIDVTLNELISNKGILYDSQVVDALLDLYNKNELI